MPNFTVIVTKDVTVSTVIEVTANNPEEAEEMAESIAEKHLLKWEMDEGNHSVPYATDVQEVGQ